MHQHFRQVCAVRLILGLAEHEVHGAADALFIFSDQQRAFASGNALRDATPERNRALVRQRSHETHRRTAVDAIAQHGGELVDLRIIERMQAPHRRSRCRHCLIRNQIFNATLF